MLIDDSCDAAEKWRRFLIEANLATRYVDVGNVANNAIACSSVRNPIIDALLPSLLQIKLCSILDEMLTQYISEKHLKMPRSYRQDLNGRISFLDDSGVIANASHLHSARENRNSLAHESASNSSWEDLENMISMINDELQHLGLVAPRAQYEFYAERKPRKEPNSGCIVTYDFCYGLKSNSKKVFEHKWTSSILNDG